MSSLNWAWTLIDFSFKVLVSANNLISASITVSLRQLKQYQVTTKKVVAYIMHTLQNTQMKVFIPIYTFIQTNKVYF